MLQRTLAVSMDFSLSNIFNNTDVAIRPTFSTLAAVFKDELGSVIHAKSWKLGVLDATVAEAEVILCAVGEAIAINFG